jgi:hypothetical protein
LWTIAVRPKIAAMSEASERGAPMRRARLAAIIASACAIALSTGCGPPSLAGQGRSAVHDDLVCVNEAPTGSHIAETRCYKRSEIEERRKADRALLENSQIHSNRPGSGKRVP